MNWKDNGKGDPNDRQQKTMERAHSWCCGLSSERGWLKMRLIIPVKISICLKRFLCIIIILIIIILIMMLSANFLVTITRHETFPRSPSSVNLFSSVIEIPFKSFVFSDVVHPLVSLCFSASAFARHIEWMLTLIPMLCRGEFSCSKTHVKEKSGLANIVPLARPLFTWFVFTLHLLHWIRSPVIHDCDSRWWISKQGSFDLQ